MATMTPGEVLRKASERFVAQTIHDGLENGSPRAFMAAQVALVGGQISAIDAQVAADWMRWASSCIAAALH